MADQEFQIQAGICGGNWWSSASKSVFTAAAAPCSVGSFGWPNHDLLDLKATRSSSGDETTTTTTTDHIFQEVIDHDHDQKPHHLQTDHNNISVSGSGSNILIDSTLQMMGFGLSSSPTSDFTNQTFVSRSSTGRAESNNNNIYSMLEQDMGTKLNYRQEIGLDSSQIQKDWTRTTASPPKDFSGDIVVDSSTVTSQALSAGFPVASSPFGYTSATLLQNLFEGETTTTTTNTNTATQPLQQQQQPFCNNYLPSSGPNFGSNNIWPRFSPLILGSRPSPPLKQQPGTGLHFSNNTPFWNASSPGLNDGVFPSTQPRQIRYVTPKFEENYKPKCNNLTNPKVNSINEDVHDSGSVGKKSSGTSGISENQPVLKRPRIETPSPLPTFKVRKEKLGDRITALQQLVSPFGKTDTASVLHEAIEYIKFLHDQVSVLSSPYMKNGASIQVHQQGSNKLKDQDESPKQDLKSRGLCLVPISSTFPVANETTADFWTPTSSFGATFR